MQYIYNEEVNKYNIYSHAEERNKYILIAVYKIVMVTISYVNKPTQARPSYLSDLRTLYLYLYLSHCGLFHNQFSLYFLIKTT